MMERPAGLASLHHEALEAAGLPAEVHVLPALPAEVLELIAAHLECWGDQYRARFSFKALSRAVAATARLLVMGNRGLPLPAEAWARFPAAVGLRICDSRCWHKCEKGELAATCQSYLERLERTLEQAPARLQELSFERSLCRNQSTLLRRQVKARWRQAGRSLLPLTLCW